MIEAFIIGAQLVYWLLLKDDTRDQVIWDACLYPGKEPQP